MELCDQIATGAAEEAITAFDNWKIHLPAGAFIGCLSEHDPADELGRLSMWRAYASGAGVAIVMNNTPFIAETDERKAFSLPVLYLSDVKFGEAIDKALDGIEGHVSALKHLNKEALTHIIFWWLIKTFENDCKIRQLVRSLYQSPHHPPPLDLFAALACPAPKHRKGRPEGRP